VIVEQEAVVSMEVVGDDLVVVCLEGDVDLTAASAIQARVREGLQVRCNVVIDLTRATFMDSAAMHVLFQAHAAAAHMGVVAVLQTGGTASAVARAIEIVGLREVYPCAESREDAIAAVRSRVGAGLS
jgi:anti-anti-sigma factor